MRFATRFEFSQLTTTFATPDTVRRRRSRSAQGRLYREAHESDPRRRREHHHRSRAIQSEKLRRLFFQRSTSLAHGDCRDDDQIPIMVGYMRRYAEAFNVFKHMVGEVKRIDYCRVRDIIGENDFFVQQSGASYFLSLLSAQGCTEPSVVSKTNKKRNLFNQNERFPSRREPRSPRSRRRDRSDRDPDARIERARRRDVPTPRVARVARPLGDARAPRRCPAVMPRRFAQLGPGRQAPVLDGPVRV